MPIRLSVGCILVLLAILVIEYSDAAPMENPAARLRVCAEFMKDCDLEDDDWPVCAIASDGKFRTFKSNCHAESAYCIERRYYVVVKDGEC